MVRKRAGVVARRRARRGRAPARSDDVGEFLRRLLAPKWKRSIYSFLENYVDRTPGSFVEEKEFSLVWHYRMSDPEFGEWLANELVYDLEQMLANKHLRVVKGQKTVEVKLMWANKGEVLKRLTRERPAPDFLLAAGDDTTDEDLFARMPANAWTIHVGENHTRAKYRLPGPEQFCQLLRDLAAVSGDIPSGHAALMSSGFSGSRV